MRCRQLERLPQRPVADQHLGIGIDTEPVTLKRNAPRLTRNTPKHLKTPADESLVHLLDIKNLLEPTAQTITNSGGSDGLRELNLVASAIAQPAASSMSSRHAQHFNSLDCFLGTRAELLRFLTPRLVLDNRFFRPQTFDLSRKKRTNKCFPIFWRKSWHSGCQSLIVTTENDEGSRTHCPRGILIRFLEALSI